MKRERKCALFSLTCICPVHDQVGQQPYHHQVPDDLHGHHRNAARDETSQLLDKVQDTLRYGFCNMEIIARFSAKQCKILEFDYFFSS